MNCPACGAENPANQEFCDSCGAHLPHEVAPPAAPPVEPPPIPASPSPAPTPPAPSPTPPKKKLTGPVIGIVAALVLLCALGCCIGSFALFNDDSTDGEDTVVVDEESDRGRIEISEERGFATSMDALEDAADQYYRGDDWWYLEISTEDDYEEYYITPDEATYDKGVIIERRNREWFVTDVYTVDMSQVALQETEPTSEEDTTPEEWAVWTVNEFMTAISEGRVDDAYALTTTPMSDYDLSALPNTYTNVEFIGAELQRDDSVIVIFTLTWEDDSTENVAATCVAENSSWYVSDMGSAD
ncbi:MAG: zinc ribbon domain-containing protein [Coriobacteriia bacterium]|nr:zinc ribbon domain-containing protein [Coriobacteriia bacterium]